MEKYPPRAVTIGDRIFLRLAGKSYALNHIIFLEPHRNEDGIAEAVRFEMTNSDQFRHKFTKEREIDFLLDYFQLEPRIPSEEQ